MRRFRHSMVSDESAGVVPVEVEAPKVPTEEELVFLEEYAREISEDLKALRARIDQIKGGSK